MKEETRTPGGRPETGGRNTSSPTASPTSSPASSDERPDARSRWHGTRPGRRPPWWPVEEPWPPDGGLGPWAWAGPWRWGPKARRPRPGFFFWRFGCLFGLFFLVAVSSAVLLLWLAGSALGWVGDRGFGDLARVAGLVVLGVAVAALVLVGRRVRRLAEPIDDLVVATRRVEAGDYSIRVPERRRGPRELRGLIRGFNTMTARLDADERQRRTLLAEVSHELRTPLAVIEGNLEGIIDGIYPPDTERIGSILEETRVLARLIDDLRTLALAEGGTLALHREPTDLQVLAGEVLDSFRVAGRAGVSLTNAVDDSLPLLDIDPVRVREVLTNLVANALDHTPAGGSIVVAGELAPASPPGEAWVRLTVTDSGTGIEPDLLPHIFKRFTKSPESRGSGLGLAIAKNLVVAHGGEIGAESSPGAGTTIWLRLPDPSSGNDR